MEFLTKELKFSGDQMKKQIILDGFESTLTNVENHSHGNVVNWFGGRYSTQEAYYFGYNGVRVFKELDYVDQIDEGSIEISTEVFLTQDGQLKKFHTFRKL
jgi:hypothetical protein